MRKLWAGRFPGAGPHREEASENVPARKAGFVGGKLWVQFKVSFLSELRDFHGPECGDGVCFAG